MKQKIENKNKYNKIIAMVGAFFLVISMTSYAYGQNASNRRPTSDDIFDGMPGLPSKNDNNVNEMIGRNVLVGSPEMEQQAQGYQDTMGYYQKAGQDSSASQESQSPPQYNEGVQPMPSIEIIGEGSKYTLGPDDVIQVMVRKQPDFSGYFVVGHDGNIQYNWAGDVNVMGMTKEEVKGALIEKLQKYVRYPEVSVIIAEYNSKAVYVMGAVNRPGKYPMKGDSMELRDALVMAGLPNQSGALKKAKIIRETEDGPKHIKVNIKDLLFKGELDKNFELMPGDIIFVPTSKFVKTTEVMSQAFGPLFQAAAVYSIGSDMTGDN